MNACDNRDDATPPGIAGGEAKKQSTKAKRNPQYKLSMPPGDYAYWSGRTSEARMILAAARMGQTPDLIPALQADLEQAIRLMDESPISLSASACYAACRRLVKNGR